MILLSCIKEKVMYPSDFVHVEENLNLHAMHMHSFIVDIYGDFSLTQCSKN